MRPITFNHKSRQTFLRDAAFHRQVQITQCGITLSLAPAVLKTTVAALAQPPFPFDSKKSHQTPVLNLHSRHHRRCELAPRFPPSRLFGRLLPCIPSRVRLAGIRKPLTELTYCVGYSGSTTGPLLPRVPSRHGTARRSSRRGRTAKPDYSTTRPGRRLESSSYPAPGQGSSAAKGAC